MMRLAGGWTVLVLMWVGPGLAAQTAGGSVSTTYAVSDSENRMELLQGAERFRWQRPDLVARLLSIREGEVVADLGAGTGFFVQILASTVGPSGTVYALETDPRFIPLLEKKGGGIAGAPVIPKLIDESEFGLPAGELDLILSVNHWHRFGDRVAARREAGEALKPGGRLVIVDWHAGEIPIAPPVERRVTRDAVVAEMESAGWTLTSESRALIYQYILIFERP